jgi:hypothetical protein
MEVVDGTWYLIIKGDYTGRVTGTVYDLTEPAAPVKVELTPQWEKCKLPEGAAASTSRRVRIPTFGRLSCSLCVAGCSCYGCVRFEP